MTRSDDPKISVVMSVYNGDRFLAPAIASILGQTYADFEMLILDDGSRDGTADIIRDFSARDPRLRPVFRENRGLVFSLNQLLAMARAPIIARMDADDLCMAHRFAVQYAFLEANPEYGVVGAQAEDIDEADRPWAYDGPRHPTSFESFLAAIPTGAPLMCHSAAMYRRDIVLAVGGYHAAFRHCEDLDLWLRLASVTRLCSLPEKLIRYRHSPDQVSTRHATEQQTGAAVARFAFAERAAGRPDPTEHLDRLPPIEDLDTLFNQPGMGQRVRATAAQGLVYSRASMRDSGFDLILRHIAEGGNRQGLWRTVARLIRFGEPTRAVRLAAALAAALAATLVATPAAA